MFFNPLGKKVEMTATKTLKWHDLAARQGRNDKPAILVANFWQLSVEEAAKGIEDSWVGAEWPARQMHPDGWLTMFGHVLDEGQYLGDDGEIKSQADLPEKLTLWRGCWPEFAYGLSWTTDRARAKWFATRLDDPKEPKGRLYEIEAHREMVLAQFNARGEDEYVLDIDQFNDDEPKEVQ
jgi:hypothetical protein